MKHASILFLSFICCLSLLSGVAFAEPSEVPTSETEYEVLVPETENIPATTCEESEEIVRTVSPVTPSNTTGLKKVLVQLFGNYDTIVTEHRYTNSNGYTSVSIDIQEDHVWITSALIFGLVLYCLFRLLGGVLCGRK